MVCMQKNRILLVQAYTPALYDQGMSNLKAYRDFLLREYPNIEKWVPEHPFNNTPTWPDRMSATYKGGTNTAGEFLAANLSTPSTVISKPIDPGLIRNELTKAVNEGFPYSHVGFSVYVDGYSRFIASALAVKKFDPNIITIAGNVGSLFEQTKDYVDHVHIGDGVPFLRELLGEDTNEPYRLKLIPARIATHIAGMDFSSRMYQVVTKIGCQHHCEFCVTNILFQGKCSGELFTPEQVHDALVQKRSKEKKDFITFFCDPTAVMSKKWWYRLFDLFREESGDFPVIFLSTASSLQHFDFDHMRNSAMRIELVNLGVESFSTIFGKNLNVDLKQTIARLHEYGIAVDATFIVGFDHHTHDNVWQEIKQLVDLDAEINDVMNLRPLPQTPIWNQLKTENRLISLPIEFYYMLYFQSFIHPHFKPGFVDMLPLLAGINTYIERERGFQGLHLQKTYQNVQNPSQYLRQQIQMYQWMGELLYSSWETYHNPSSIQCQRYRKILDEGKNIDHSKVSIENLPIRIR